ncbi:hypothetical protein [Bradyrhizobium sp. SZCCHNRI3052]|uniref:hypothetical protein n=1 Tax=Bradyrhizobium sp. SZCCHNRI3052 TaxID=3057295 RepID=UPI002916C493|nr:hypothetical protein [Bradyrhizobium sp. SZCCHNRI3052]
MTDVTRACDTCKHLKVPADPDHAKHYRVCTVITPLPANMHVWNREEIEGRQYSSQRWITIHCVETKLGLKDCELHEPRGVP